MDAVSNFESFSARSENFNKSSSFDKKPVFVVGGVVLAIVAYWAATNSWPVVAMVGMRPVTRQEINSSLFNKGGKAEIDNKITEIQIMNALKSKGIKVSSAEIDSKVADVKMQLGAGVDLNQILASRGLSMTDYRRQLELLMGAEKAVSDKIVISDDDVKKFADENKDYITATGEARLSEARNMLRMSRLDEEIQSWVEEIRKDTKGIWRLPGTFDPSPTPVVMPPAEPTPTSSK